MKYSQIPFIIATLTMIGGIFIAILFGVNESYFKNKIKDGLKKNQKIMSITDTSKKIEKLRTEASKNWRYYQRFHFHSSAIGSMVMVILILLNFSSAPAKLISLTSWSTSIGGFLYPFVWLFAGIYGPIMGRHEAKEAFAIFGYAGGLFLVGLVLLIFILIKYPLKFKQIRITS
jgi:hypothetical protein